MKKSKLSITLVTGFIAAMALSACNNVTASKDAIVTFTPYGSKEKVALLTDDVYNAYSKTSNGISKFYDKILEVLIRYEFKENNFKDGELEDTFYDIENEKELFEMISDITGLNIKTQEDLDKFNEDEMTYFNVHEIQVI